MNREEREELQTLQARSARRRAAPSEPDVEAVKPLTVESALAELREMFPDETIQVSTSAWYWKDQPAKLFQSAAVMIGLEKKMPNFKSDFGLADCMKLVRKWKETTK